ncbi:MAG: glycoside hydrolase family 57 protein, partial [Candidatus Aenigmatarchaeota archaeon]
MPSIRFYFQVHQPMRLNNFSVFDMGKSQEYFDNNKNHFYIDRVSRKCYLPTNKKILDLIKKTEGRFKISLSITGILIEELEKNFPHVLDSFRSLVDTGCVELFCETYYHSLAYLVSEKEFREQVKLHKEKILDTFGFRPRIFRNTEAMYSNDVARQVRKLGFKGIVAEGLSHILEWRSPNYLYSPPDSDMSIFLRNYKLSDDIGFRFSCRNWPEWPLKADKYASWLSNANGDLVNLFLDYETFGEHQWKDTGIFDFLEHMPTEALKYDNLEFKTASEILKSRKPVGIYDVPNLTSWADVNRDLSAWLENSMQQHAFNQMKDNEPLIRRKKELIDTWRKLQTSDHFYYYMCTKWFADGDVHKYF